MNKQAGTAGLFILPLIQQNPPHETSKTKQNAASSCVVWKEIKSKYKTAIIFVKNGESYVTFEKDADLINQLADVKIVAEKNLRRTAESRN